MICNTGVGLTPTVDGTVHHFAAQGLYNGLFLMVDRETGTSWNHITGEALHGPLTGDTLEVRPVEQTTVEQALEQDPETLAAISERRFRRGRPGFLDRIRGLSPMFRRTMAPEDDRLGTMAVGLGVWNDRVKRFYPQEVVREEGVVVDDLDGRRIVVFYDADAYSLKAYYTDAESARHKGGVIRLSNGNRIEEGVVHDGSGERLEVDRPLQVYTRWYGFSLTFPEPEIYDGG